jgi:hypothetical protein
MTGSMRISLVQESKLGPNAETNSVGQDDPGF